MKVCWLTTVAAPYTIRLFEEIAKKVDLCVVLNDAKEENRNDEWKIIESDSFRLYIIDENYKHKIRELAQEYDILVDGVYLSKYGYIAVNEFRKQNKKIVMAADGGIPKNRGFIINGIMSYLMNRHDYFLSSSEITDRYFNFYGVDSKKISHYRFTSLTEKDIRYNRELIKKRNELRKKLGIDDKFTIISVGQPIDRKGFDILVKAYLETGLKDEMNLYIIGGKAQDKVQKIVDDNRLDNVHFIDLIGSKELGEYYAASDLFVLCTREDIWGLVIQEAMSYGLPVITSDNCVAGLHFNKLDGSVEICESENVKEYADCIRKYYGDDKLLKQLSEKSLDSVKGYTIENSSQDIINILSLL